MNNEYRKFVEWYEKEVLGKKDNPPNYDELFNPIKYKILERKYVLVMDLIHDRMRDEKWYHEFKPKIKEIVKIVVGATMFYDEIIPSLKE